MQPNRSLVALILVAAVAGLVLGRSLAARSAGSGQARVVYVVDGDTVHVERGGRELIVRLIGVDAPEVPHPGKPGACYGAEATTFVRRAVLGRPVRLVAGVEPTDRYGRSLAEVVVLAGPLAGRDLSEELAAHGLARPLAIPPNTSDAPRIATLVRQAQRASLGLWSACGFTAAFPNARR